MGERVQEFGKIKAIGATNSQLRKIVLQEGLFVAAIAIPLGLLVGTILTRFVIAGMFALYENENLIMQTVYEMIKEGKTDFYVSTKGKPKVYDTAEKAILDESDIHSESMTVNRSMFRKFVGDTDAGQEMKETIKDLEKLLEAYRSGELSERL